MKLGTTLVLVAIVGFALVGAVPRETGKLYLVVEKSTQHVLQIGISPESVGTQDSEKEVLVVIDGEKPSHLSENYFKLVDGELVDMTGQEKAAVDLSIVSKEEDEEVARLKAIMARDPAGFRAILGL